MKLACFTASWTSYLANSNSGFPVGDHVSLADITTVGWVVSAGW